MKKNGWTTYIADVAKRICSFQKSHRNDGVFIFIKNNKKRANKKYQVLLETCL